MAEWIGLNFGGGKLFGWMEVLAKFQLTWKCQSGTSFTKLSAGQKLDGIFERNWLDKMM